MSRAPRDGDDETAKVSRVDLPRRVEPIDSSWVTTIAGEVVGTISLCREQEHVARIASFHVDPEWQHTSVVTKLIDSIHHHCCCRGVLKIVLDSHVAPHWLLVAMMRRGLQFAGRRVISGGDVFEFYIDLYYGPAEK